MSEAAEIEALLRRAFTPVDPPEHLAERVERTLAEIAELAADELDSLEVAALRDPRNWARPAAAAVVGVSAGAALVLMRARRRRPAPRVFESVERALADVAAEARRALER